MMSYLTQITQVRDELAAVGVAVDDGDMVRNALNGMSDAWYMFVQAILGMENMPNWERLRDDLI